MRTAAAEMKAGRDLERLYARHKRDVYRFVLREMPGAFLRAWRLEAQRLLRSGRRAWHQGNEILQAGAVTARILRHLRLPEEVPAARAPPLPNGDESW